MTTQYPLGRKVHHDLRSLAFPVAGLPISSLKSVHWQRRVPIFDQKSLGSCTGNAGAGWVGTDNAQRQGLTEASQPIDESYAVGLYSQATKLDGDPGVYPPTDTGSSGLGIAKALKARKLVAKYHHAFSLQACLTALQSGPVLLGVPWHSSSFTVRTGGYISIFGPVVGGHEILADEIDVDHQRIGFSNSWSESWGIKGRAYLTWSDLQTLLADQGDAVQLQPA